MRVVAVLLATVVAGCGSSSNSAQVDLEMCARISACFEGSDSFAMFCGYYTLADITGRVSDGTDDQLVASLVDCVKAAPDCAAAKACTAATSAQVAACAGGSASTCVGDVLVECDGSDTPDAIDCGAAGLVCGQTAGGGAACGTASCDPATTPPTCDGLLAVSCDEAGVLVAKDCRVTMTVSCSGTAGEMTCQSRVGETCGIVDGEAECVGTGAACDESTYQNSCDGSVMVTCSGGAVGELDCAAFDPGFACRIEGHGQTGCAPSATECDVETYVESCAKGVITFCLLGELTTVDCTSFGYSGCSMVPDTEVPAARCTL
jgi:hypothetical protein